MAGKLPSNKKNSPSLKGKYRIAIVYSEWHENIVNNLLEACKKVLLDQKSPPSEILIHSVPGSFELPLAAQWLLETKSLDGIICLGCIVKGETQHDEFIAHAINKSLLDLSLKFGKPVINGVLTTMNIKQAKARSGGKLGNKGKDCAYTLLKMIYLRKMIQKIAR
ncbi:MAG: 6,7-dimethyl-8-ribityllumazine synthase [Saprospiraceae bacterium]|nr:6,7-dimethyl-8-ribityllumazine synthase [Saprospiraceae bacterium]